MAEKTRKHIVQMRMYHFQSHIDQTIKFDPITNAIVGPSDSGKSSIARALFLTLYNKPTRGIDEYITNGTNHFFVEVTFSDGTTIVRGRNRGENYYILTQGNETKEFKGFGFEVPPEITAAHGMPLMDFDDSGQNVSLNVSMQLDPIFMFEESATRRAKVIGKISGADRVDGALGVAAEWLKDKRGTHKELNRRKKELDESINKYSYLVEMGGLITKLNELVELGRVTNTLRDELVGSMAKINLLVADRLELEALVTKEKGLSTLEEHFASMAVAQGIRDIINSSLIAYSNSAQDRDDAITIINNSDKILGLDTVLVQLNKDVTMRDVLEAEWNDYQVLVKQLDEAKRHIEHSALVGHVEGLLDGLRANVDALTALSKEWTVYVALAGRHASGTAAIEKAAAELVIITNHVNEVIADNGGICPLCGSQGGKHE